MIQMFPDSFEFITFSQTFCTQAYGLELQIVPWPGLAQCPTDITVCHLQYYTANSIGTGGFKLCPVLELEHIVHNIDIIAILLRAQV